VEHTRHLGRFGRALGHVVLDLDRDVATDTDVVSVAIVLVIDREPLDTQDLTINGAMFAMGPPIWPEKTPASLSACSLDALSSMMSPTFQLPSSILFGASARIDTLWPLTSTPSIWPCCTW